jgi:hypothetical protein
MIVVGHGFIGEEKAETERKKEVAGVPSGGRKQEPYPDTISSSRKTEDFHQRRANA